VLLVNLDTRKSSLRQPFTFSLCCSTQSVIALYPVRTIIKSKGQTTSYSLELNTFFNVSPFPGQLSRTDDARCYFFDTSQEIRDIIYHYVLSYESGLVANIDACNKQLYVVHSKSQDANKNKKPPNPLALVCHQLHSETRVVRFLSKSHSRPAQSQLHRTKPVHTQPVRKAHRIHRHGSSPQDCY
jgi:hypothetical protein